MTVEELHEEINIEIELIDSILQEILMVRRDVSDREPTMREKMAAAAFMAQCDKRENLSKKNICRC